MSDTREVQTGLDLRLNRTFVSRVAGFVGWERTPRGIRARAKLSEQFNLTEVKKLADLYDNYGSAGLAESELPEFVVEFQVVTPTVIRFRTCLEPKLEDSPYDDLYFRWPDEAPPFEVVEEKKAVRVRTGGLELLVRSESDNGARAMPIMSYCVKDRGGRVLIDELVDEKSIYFGYILPPLGRQRDEGGEWTVQSFARSHDEDFYGFGEQFTDFTKRGQVVDIWNSDPGNCMSSHSYKNIPFFLSTRGYGLVLNTCGHSVFDMGSRSAAGYTIKVRGGRLDYLVIADPDPRGILKTYYELTGMPSLPPRWSFGLWMSTVSKYRDQQKLLAAADELRARGLPCDVLHIDPPWMRHGSLVCDLTWGANFPDHAAMIRQLAEKGFKLCLWMCPYVPVGCEMYEDGVARGCFVKDPHGKVLVNPGVMNFWSAPFAYVDFTDPDAAGWFKERLRRVLGEGVAVLKADLCELGPEEALYYNGMNGVEGHNYYTREYSRVVYEACREVHGDDAVIWCRSGSTGAHLTPIHWAGDVKTNFDDMAGQLRAVLGAGMSGFAFFSHDIGGFQGRPDEELFIRWYQLGMFTSHARAHGGAPREPWEYGQRAEAVCRSFARLRYRLLPHIWSHAIECCRRGEPMLKSLYLEFPKDRNVRTVGDEYIFCDDLLVAPVCTRADQRAVYFPTGRWVDYFTGRACEGPAWVDYECPIERMPLFVREGAALVTTEPMDFVPAGSGWRSLTLEVFGDGSGEKVVNLDARTTGRIRYSASGVTPEATAEGLDCPVAVVRKRNERGR